MSALDDFLNLFADPNAVFKQQDIEGRLATAQSLSDLISQGVKTPFEAELFPGEAPIQGLSTAKPATQQDLITTLLQSQSPEFAGQGVNLAMQALQQQGQSDIAAKGREALNKAIENIQNRGTLGQQALAGFIGSPYEKQALESLFKTFQPTTLSPDQIRIGAFAQPISKGLPKAEDLEKKRQEEFKNATTLRKEFLGVSDEYAKQNKAYGRVIASATDPSPAGDLALIFNYMKVLDPGSTVREGEFATAQNAGSVPTMVAALYNRVASGQRLTEQQRRDFVDRSTKLFEQASKQHKVTAKQFKELATRAGVNPLDVVIQRQTVGPLSASPNASIEPPPPPGYVRQ